MNIDLTIADWVRLEQAATFGPPLGNNPQDVRIDDALKAVVRPPPPPVLAGACINATSGQIDWVRAAAAGCQVGRTDHGTFRDNINWATHASDFGMGLLWINHNLNDMGPLLAEYASLPAASKAVVVGFCHGNENWEGAGTGPKMNGKAYGESYVKAVQKARNAKCPVPVLCQVRLAPDIRDIWMRSLVTASGLGAALVGNWLDSHPYMGRMTSPQRSSSVMDYTDTDGRSWGSQRYLKEIDLIHAATGVNCPLAITEYGTASAPAVPDSVGSATEVAKHMTAAFEHLKTVGEGKVKTPEGLTASVPVYTYYDQYAWNLKGAESYGFYGPDQKPRIEGGVWTAWTTGIKAL